MTTDGDRGATSPADELQFDHAEYAAEPVAAAAVTCAACSRPIAEAYYEVAGKVLCGGCRDAVVAHFTGGSRLARFARALAFGGLAALGGAALYYLVVALTGYRIGLISILVGVMVGKAVSNGSRHRGGLGYQVLAVFLTYTAIVTEYTPMIVPQVLANFEKLAENQKAAPNPVDPAKASPVGGRGHANPAEPAGERRPLRPGSGADAKREPVSAGLLALGIIVFAGFVMALAYAYPLLLVAQDPITLLIIFFGLQQAWQLNRKARPEIKGPFLVGAGGLPPRGAPADA